MKLNRLLMPALLLMAMTGCINDADVPGGGGAIDGKDGDVTFSIIVSNSDGSTRTDNGTVDDSGIHDLGNANEYKVNNVRLYLFNSLDNKFIKSIPLTNLGSAEILNSYYASYNSKNIAVDPGSYRIFAIANEPKVYTPVDIDNFMSNLDDIYASGAIKSVPDNGFVMTNRGKESPDVTVILGQKQTISITLERVVAKIVFAKNKSAYSVVDQKGSTYATVTPTNFRFVNLTKNYYVFRHVAQLSDGDDTPASIPFKFDEHFGIIPNDNGYAIDPNFFNKNKSSVKELGKTIYVNPLVLTDSNSAYETMPGQYDPTNDALKNNFTSIYCLENCMFRPVQLQGYTTGIIIKCNLVPNNCLDETGVPVPSIPTTVYYYNANFYVNTTAIKNAGGQIPASGDYATDAELAQYGIKKFAKTGGGNFACYYNYWIKHFDDQKDGSGVMEYAIVRNNIYNVTITKILGIGDPNPNVDPEIPVDKVGYLDATFSVKPWVVRGQDAELK